MIITGTTAEVILKDTTTADMPRRPMAKGHIKKNITMKVTTMIMEATTMKATTENLQGRLRYDRYLTDRLSLFLIGTGLNQQTLKKVGIRPLLQGLTLWIIVGGATLALILLNWIHI